MPANLHSITTIPPGERTASNAVIHVRHLFAGCSRSNRASSEYFDEDILFWTQLSALEIENILQFPTAEVLPPPGPPVPASHPRALGRHHRQAMAAAEVRLPSAYPAQAGRACQVREGEQRHSDAYVQQWVDALPLPWGQYDPIYTADHAPPSRTRRDKHRRSSRLGARPHGEGKRRRSDAHIQQLADALPR
ncbi:hypothetical protein HYPSUDRAFT_202289 [Hypholoma sublateritium FD-334 SS-4]|uniref:Uncharacterized protein n=1 Tax=Hypholoma sublateritium (strain FD-334 SS-4) TaxID=945553 RepID=A0A0D2L5Y2_HYPSF|nr:hypothetical protein HYPSUDRAFT_202289 [Hypholoma sublateritium FD-334 SS-4]